MRVLDVRMVLLPDNNEHHKVAFAEVLLGDSKPLLIIRPFAVLKVGEDETRVQWPRREDKKRGGYYLYAEAIDKDFRGEIEDAVLTKYQAMKLAGALPNVPGKKVNWYYERTWANQGKED